jgi:polyhydroxybutyrate depolymerase
VVLNWHGLGSDGHEQATVTRYEALAEIEGFIVVHPTGVPDPGLTENSWEVFDDQDPGRDDLAFAGALIDHVLRNYCTDPDRVYSTGMSNGGFFTARLICERADVIAAGVSVAGTYHPDDCFPSRDVPYRAYHGTADQYVPIDGVGSLLLQWNQDPLFVAFITQVPPEEFGEFAGDAGCRTSTTQKTHRYVRTTSYTDCRTSAPLEFLTLDGAEHSWPGVQNWQPGDPVINTSVDATEDGWDFMKQFSLAD